MTIAYLVNQYPKISHSFIRREIVGLEAAGVPIARFSIRSCGSELVDPADQQELAKTRFVLGVGAVGLLSHLMRVLVSRPGKWFQALQLAIQAGRKSDRGVLIHIIYLAEACVLLHWFRQAGVRHVHAHFGTNSTTVAMLCQALGGPSYSFTVHGPEEFDRPEMLSMTEKIKRAAFVVAISHYGRSQLMRWSTYDQWPKIQIVHCGVDDSFLHQPLTPIPDRPALVCVGRLTEQKGQLLLLDALSRVATEGIPFQLTFVGDGPLRPQIEALIQRYGLEAQVKITGWASGEEVRDAIMHSRALVLPSLAEGLPVVIMEALALYRPVISTYIAGIPELVESGVDGWLVPAGSIEPLVEAIKQAVQLPPAQLEQMGQVGAGYVAERHNIATEAQTLAQLFGKVTP